MAGSEALAQPGEVVGVFCRTAGGLAHHRRSGVADHGGEEVGVDLAVPDSVGDVQFLEVHDQLPEGFEVNEKSLAVYDSRKGSGAEGEPGPAGLGAVAAG